MDIQPNFPDTLRALSIAGPYAYEIAVGHKLSEGRDWRTNYRGIVLLHVSTGRDFGQPQSKDMISAIIGAAEVYGCTPNSIYDRYYDHLMRNPVLFKTFIPNVSGSFKYWKPRTSEHIAAFNAAWEQLQILAPELIQTSQFKVQTEGKVVKISSFRTETAFEVADDEVWQCFKPRVRDGEIALSKSEFTDFYRKRLA